MTDRSRVREEARSAIEMYDDGWPLDAQRLIPAARLVADPSTIILTDQEGLREKIAAGLWRHDYEAWSGPWSTVSHEGKEMYRGKADAVLAVLTEEGTG